ncbi:MAG: hypothetical protein OWV35_04870 [Firmicutes bacterium]|nr:hypothetical protein [Bacillota bacterium]
MGVHWIARVGAATAVVIGLLELSYEHGAHVVAILGFPILSVITALVYERQRRRLILTYEGLFVLLTGAEFLYWARLERASGLTLGIYAAVVVALVLLMGLLTVLREQAKLHQWWMEFKALWKL